MENKELEQIKKLPTNKMEIALYAERIGEALDNGEVDPLLVLRQFKAVENLYKAIKPVLDKLALKEAEKYPEATIDLHGVKFTKKNAGGKWNYENCNDGTYVMLLQYKAEYDKKVKEREEFLQSLKQPIEIVDEDSGEIIKIFPPTKESGMIVQTNFM